jgi:rhodanese-related sulfurtransferase
MSIFSSIKTVFPFLDMGDESARISAAELKALIDKKERISLVDVRTPEEHRGGHIPGSVSIPLNTIQNHKSLPNKGRVVLYCAGGVRSVKARKLFSERGIQEAVDLKGGINAWIGIGGKVTSK